MIIRNFCNQIAGFGWILFSTLIIVGLSYTNKFPENYIFSGGDVVQYFNWDYIKDNFSYIWANNVGEGAFSPVYGYKSFYVALLFLANILNLSPSEQSVIYYIFMIYGSYLSALLALIMLNKEKWHFSSLGANLLALIYAINPYTCYAFYFIWGFSPFLSAYIAMPIYFALIILYFNSSNFIDYKKIILFYLLNTFFCITYSNLPFFIGINIIVFLYILINYFICKNIKKKDYLYKILIFISILLFSTSWIIIPQLIFLLNGDSPAWGREIFDTSSWILWQRMPFWISFALNPEFGEYLERFPYLFISSYIFIITIAFLGIIDRFLKINQFYKQQKIIFIIIFLVAILIESKGIYIFWEDLSVWIFSLPVLNSLRSNGKIFILIPSIIFLIIFFSITSTEKKFKNIFLLTILFFSGLSSWPFISGDIQQRNSIAFPSGENCETSKSCFLNKIPADYFSIAKIIKNNGMGGKILSTPFSVDISPGWVKYPAWKHVGVDPTPQIFSLPVVQMNMFHQFGYPWGKYLMDPDFSTPSIFMDYIQALGISYIIFHKDVDEKYHVRPSKFLENLANTKEVLKIYVGEHVDLYIVNSEYRKDTITLANDEYTKITYSKDNSTRYLIEIKNYSDNIKIIFRETFSKHWKLYLASCKESFSDNSWFTTFFLKKLTNDGHTRYFNYGNIWDVNMTNLCETNSDLEMQNVAIFILQLVPQNYVYLFQLFSFGFFIVIIAFWLKTKLFRS